MPLPPRPFHVLNDVAVRWSAMPIDIVGWAMGGLLALSAALSPIRTGSSRVFSDIVEIAGSDVIPLFRPDGAREALQFGASVRRAKRNGSGSANRLKVSPSPRRRF